MNLFVSSGEYINCQVICDGYEDAPEKFILKYNPDCLGETIVVSKRIMGPMDYLTIEDAVFITVNYLNMINSVKIGGDNHDQCGKDNSQY